MQAQMADLLYKRRELLSHLEQCAIHAARTHSVPAPEKHQPTKSRTVREVLQVIDQYTALRLFYILMINTNLLLNAAL